MKKILRFLRNKKIKLFSDLAKNKKIIFVFLLIFFLGIFLRVYHHRDWLLFHLDQSRDALIVSEAIENGPTHLPLHGPHASSTGLKEKIYLGPIFYYFQYFFALVFGYAPNILAWPDLFFSILSICLFYLFTRKYFSVPISLSLMLIFSCSFFLIIYGRFAWNPNATLFFMLLMLLSLANMAEKKTSRSLIWWFLLAAFSMSVLIQLHFITFFLAPFIFLLFLIWQRKVISLKLFLAGAVMICLISLPVIVNEHQSDWKNFGNLRSSILGKMKGSDKKDIPGEKIIESVQKISFYGWAGISADEKLEPLKVYRKKSGMPALKCSAECRSKLPHLLWSLVFFFSGTFLLLFNYFKEKDVVKKNFLRLNLFLLLGFFLTITPIIKDDYARFYLVLSILALIFVGFWMEIFEKKFHHGWKGIFLVFSLAVMLCVPNLAATKNYFDSLRKVSNWETDFEKKEGILLPEGEMTTYLQLEKIAELIEEKSKNNGINSIVLAVDNFYARSLAYIINNRDEKYVEAYYKLSDFDPPFEHEQVYYVIRKNSGNHFNDETKEFYQTIFKKEAGSLVIYLISARKK